MSEWQLDRLPEDVRQVAENAAQQAGLPLHRWLGRIIRDASVAEDVPKPRETSRSPEAPLSYDAQRPYDVQRSREVPRGYPAEQPRERTMPPAAIMPTSASYPPQRTVRPLETRPAAETRTVPEGRALWSKVQPAPPPPPIPAIKPDERQAAIANLVASLQRGELSPIGEARGYLKLLTEHMANITELTVATGRTREQVARTLRLLGLSDRLRDYIDKGMLTRDQAFALLDAADPEAFASVILPSAAKTGRSAT